MPIYQELFDNGVSEVVFGICVVAAFAIAAINIAGVKSNIKKKYRDAPNLRAYQKFNALLYCILGASGTAIWFMRGLPIEGNRVLFITLGVAAVLAVILIGVNDRAFVKRADKAMEENAG